MLTTGCSRMSIRYFPVLQIKHKINRFDRSYSYFTFIGFVTLQINVYYYFFNVKSFIHCMPFWIALVIIILSLVSSLVFPINSDDFTSPCHMVIVLIFFFSWASPPAFPLEYSSHCQLLSSHGLLKKI